MLTAAGTAALGVLRTAGPSMAHFACLAGTRPSRGAVVVVTPVTVVAAAVVLDDALTVARLLALVLIIAR